MSTDFNTFREQFNNVIRAFVDDLKEIADDLQKTKALEPGDRISADDARGLPIGASFTDGERDVWYVTEAGFSWNASGTSTTDLDPAEYAPLTLRSLPEPEVDLAEDDEDDEEAPTQEALADWEKELLGDKPYHVQVGDRVRVTAGVNSYEGQVGTVGKVKTIETGLPLHISKTGARYTIEGSWFYAGDVEKVPAIKVGDTVKVIKDFYPHRTQHLGKVGTVVDINRPAQSGRAEVPFVVELSGVRWYAAEVEPVTASETPEPVPAPETGTLADPYTSRFRFVDRNGDILDVDYLGYATVIKVHTNRGGQRDFASVYLTASDLDDVIDRLQEIKKAYEA